MAALAENFNSDRENFNSERTGVPANGRRPVGRAEPVGSDRMAARFASRCAASGGIAAIEPVIARPGPCHQSQDIPLGHPLKPSCNKFVGIIAAGAIDKARKKQITKETKRTKRRLHKESAASATAQEAVAATAAAVTLAKNRKRSMRKINTKRKNVLSDTSPGK